MKAPIAILAGCVALAALVSAAPKSASARYHFTLDPDAVIDIKRQITLLPANGIPVILEQRE